MAIKIEVTNSGEVDLGRDNKLFPAGETVPHTASGAEGLAEISDHPDLDVVIREVGADDQLPPSFKVVKEYDITDSARELAEEHDLDLEGVHGTGSQGRITKQDVEAAVRLEQEEGEKGPQAAAPDNRVTSEDPLPKQMSKQVAPHGVQAIDLADKDPDEARKELGDGVISDPEEAQSK